MSSTLKQRGFLGLTGHLQGPLHGQGPPSSWNTKQGSRSRTSLLLEQEGKGAGQSPGFHFTPKHDNHTMQMCASFQSFSLRGHMI